MQTETTAATEATIATQTLTTPITRLQPGNHPATITGAAIVRNHNGKLNVELDCDLNGRRMQHNMYMTTPAGQANTAKQLKNAFGIESFKDVPSIVGQSCVLRMENEEYNGRTSLKVVYINPHSSEVAADIDFDALDAGFTAPAETEVLF
jgi:hypothetical protein